MKPLSLINIILFCSLIQSQSTSIAVYDPFSQYFNQFKQDISSFTNRKIVRVDSLSDSILSYSTLFLFLAKGSNQGISFQSYKLTKKEQRLLIEYLMKDKNLHIFAQSESFFYENVKEENSLLSYLEISYAGALMIGFGVDSAIGSGTALFRENIERFQIIRKDTLQEGILWADTPVIRAKKEIIVISGCSDSSCDKISSGLSYLFYPKRGKVIIDLFYFLDYKPYLKTLCKFYDIPVGINYNGLYNTNNKKSIESTIILKKQTYIYFHSFYDKNFDEVFLTDLKGKQYYHYSANTLANRKINIAKLSPALYLLTFLKNSSVLNTKQLFIVD